MKQILFNTEMVRAILDGRKTMTRRVMKPQPPDGVKWLYPGSISGIWRSSGDNVWFETNGPCDTGDVFWVRETWTKEGGKYFYRADFDSDFLDSCETLSGGYPHECAYHPGCEGCMREPQRIFWRPSIHMPREAARIFLRVTNVRAERLQNITPDQIDAEGYKEWAYGAATGELLPSGPSWFQIAWDSTIKPTDLSCCGWEANPWVWVIEFERIKKEEAINGA